MFYRVCIVSSPPPPPFPFWIGGNEIFENLLKGGGGKQIFEKKSGEKQKERGGENLKLQRGGWMTHCKNKFDNTFK